MESLLQEMKKQTELLEQILGCLQKQKQSNAPEIVNDETNKMIDIFYKVNPTINYGNKTMRKSVENLYKVFGTEKALKMAEYACSILGTPYAPTITTPQELETKATALAAFYQKSQSSNGVANFKV